MPSNDATTPLLLFMQKVEDYFQVANQEKSFGNVCMIQNGFTFFDRNSRLAFKLPTAYSNSEPVVIP